MLKRVLSLLLVGSSVFAQSQPMIRSGSYGLLTVPRGAQQQNGNVLENEGLENTVENQGFEYAGIKWQATGQGIFSYNTNATSAQAANVARGLQSGKFTAVAANDSLVSSAPTYSNGLVGRAGYVQCLFKGGTSSVYTLSAKVGGSNLCSVTVPAGYSFQAASCSFTFPTPATTAQVVVSASGAGGALYVDSCYLGEQAPTTTSTFGADALPVSDDTFSLGSPSQRWKDLYVAGASNLDGTITVSGFGTGVVHSNSSGLLSSSTIVNADVSNSAAIARSKIASGSANQVVLNDGSGNLTSSAVLGTSNGGTGLSSVGTSNQFLRSNGSTLQYDTITTDNIPEGSTNKYFSQSSARQSISATSPVAYNNSTGVISMPVATSLQSGYLSNSDWGTFNNKQAAGNYITALTGEVSASGPGSASATVGNSAVISKVLTGLSTGTCTNVTSTDQILAAMGKLECRMEVNDAKVSGFPNPMTTSGDIIIDDTGTTTRLPIGATGQVLTVFNGLPTWRNSASGFSNPMTTKGDMIYENASLSPTRLGIGTDNQILSASGGLPVWVDPSFAVTDLSNVTNTNIPADLLPATDNNYDIGSALKQWQDLFVAGTITDSSLGLGLVHSSSGGAFSSSLLVNADVSATAGIAFSKLASLTSGNILVGNGSNAAASVAMTGDVTISNTGVTAIGANKVANSQLAQMGANTIKGNNTAGTANAADLTATQVTAMLNAFVGDSGSGGTKGLVPAPASGDAAAGKYLKADGSWATVPPGGVTTVGTYDSQSAAANGLTISSSTIYAQSADATHPGMVNNTTQTLSGVKTFSSAPNLSSLTASRPLKLDGSKNITASQIDLTSSNDVTGALTVPNGGTGLTSITAHNLLIGNGTSAATLLAPGTSGFALVSQGASSDPAWASVLSNPMTTGGDIIYGGASGTPTRLANGSAQQVLTSAGGTSAPTWTSLPTSPIQIQNSGLSTSVATNALTVALKQADGSTDPSTGSAAVSIAFRSATLTSGAYNVRTVTSSLSLTVPSGASLGHASGLNQYVWVYALDNSGTVELAVSGVKVFDDWSIASTTAISSGSTSGTTLYSTSARSNVPIRLIGRLLSNQSAAGTWASAMTEVDVNVKPAYAVTDWASYTPTTQGFGTISVGSAFDCRWRREGADMLLQIKFTAGTTSGSQAQIGIPSGYTISSTVSPSINVAGVFGTSNTVDSNPLYMKYTGGNSYFTAGFKASGVSMYTDQNGTLFSTGNVVEVDNVRVPIQGWSAYGPLF